MSLPSFDDRSPSQNEKLSLDLAGNRLARKYTSWEQALRVFWSIGSWAIALSPRPLFAWRRLVLRTFGAKIGQQVNIYPSTRIYMPWNIEIGDWTAIGEEVFIYNLGRVSIGREVTISYRAHICAGSHDFSSPQLPLIKPPVYVEDQAWIGTDAFVGPGVTIARGAIVAARAVVVKNVASLQIVAGNPARQIGMRSEK